MYTGVVLRHTTRAVSRPRTIPHGYRRFGMTALRYSHACERQRECEQSAQEIIRELTEDSESKAPAVKSVNVMPDVYTN
jgi:hypothetical protein